MFSALVARNIPRRYVAPTLRSLSTQHPQSGPSSSQHAEHQTSPQGEQPTPAASGSSLPSLDFTPEVEQEQRTGAKSSKDSLSTIEKRRQVLGRISLALLFAGVGVQAFYLGREWEEGELKDKKLRIEDAPSTRWARTAERIGDIFDYFSKPAWSELLPPPLPAPHQKPYTLLLSLDDLLITSTWDRQNGWRTAKRPGVDYFLAYLAQFYEIVIFTTQNSYTAIPILEKLDRYNFFIQYKLFREATRSVNGKIVKDLSYLNRDLSKVILLDTVEEHVSTHPENAIVIPKWKGQPGDRGLVSLIPFLESIAIYHPDDVRPILNAYRGKDIAIEYAKKEAEAKAKHIEEWKKGKKSSSSAGGGGGLTLTGLFGGSSSPSGPSPSSPVPLTYLEQKRKEAQAIYLEEQAYIEKNKAEFERLLEADQKAMASEGPGNLLEALSMIQGGKAAAEKPPVAEEGKSSS